MNRIYEYRLYPRHRERATLELMLEQGREVYNAALAQSKVVFETTGNYENGLAQCAYFREWRKQPGILLNASSLQQILRRLDKAYAAFFRRLKAKEKPGHPRFKPPARFNSLEYRYGDGCSLRYDANKDRLVLYVQNVGEVKIKTHRLLPAGAQVKHVVIKRKAGGWYVHLMLTMPDPIIDDKNDLPAVGVDMGLLRLLTLSDGTQIDNPRWLRTSLTDLRVAQRRLSRRQKGSRRRRKARQVVARLHERVANSRRDFWHKMTHWLTKQYGLVVLEDLTLGFMIHNRHLSLSAHDAGLGHFQQLLEYKAGNAGTTVILVDPAYTSQTCSGCGELVEKTLSVRVHQCPYCGLEIDRDENAARNILFLAFKSARIESSGVNVGQRPVRSLRSPTFRT